MEIRDSRRVPGPNLLWDRSCAVLDATLERSIAERFLREFELAAASMLAELGWRGESVRSRRFRDGASIALSAPLDALYAATEINEWAFAAARAAIAGDAAPDLKDGARKLRATIARERGERRRLVELQRETARRRVALLADDRVTSIGMGAGSLSWPTSSIPALDSIDWKSVHDVPCAMVTGTNGKSTTVRLLASILRAAGRTPGLSTTDWVRVGDATLDQGDYSGPSGARMALRDPRVDAAALETARGGMLRRGLALRRVDAAAILNVADDHLGEWGVDDLQTLIDAKWVLSRAVEADGLLVLNADDAGLVARANGYRGAIAWFTLDPRDRLTRAHVERGGRGLWHADRWLVSAEGARERKIVRVDEIPIAFGGAARHNLANALAATALAERMGIEPESIARGLASFSGDAEDNPGRLNVFELGGVRVLVDFAHNPHGFEAFFDMVARLPAKRRAVLLGQAGDRDEHSIRELVRIAWRVRPEHIVIKEMPSYLRGRALGEVPAMIADELEKLGVEAWRIARADTELDAMKDALRWAREGDVLLLLAHSERKAALALLADLRAREWKPGEAVV